METGKSIGTIFFGILLSRSPCFRSSELPIRIFSPFIAIIISIITSLIQSEMHPLIIQSSNRLHAIYNFRFTLTKWCLYRPSQFIYDTILPIDLTVLKEITQMETDSLRLIMTVTKRNLLLCNSHLSSRPRLLLLELSPIFARLHLQSNLVQRVDRYRINIGSISLNIVIVNATLLFPPISQMNEVLHLPAKHFSSIIILQLHLYISSDHHIRRKIIGILEHTNIAAMLHPIDSIRNRAFVVKVIRGFQRAATIMITSLILILVSNFRHLPILHHIKGELRSTPRSTPRSKILKINKIRSKEIASILRIVSPFSLLRVDIPIIISTIPLHSTLFIIQDIRNSGNIHNLPLSRLETLDIFAFLEFEPHLGIDTLKHQRIVRRINNSLSNTFCSRRFVYRHSTDLPSHKKTSVPADNLLIQKSRKLLKISLYMNSRRKQIRRNPDHIRIQIGYHI